MKLLDAITDYLNYLRHGQGTAERTCRCCRRGCETALDRGYGFAETLADWLEAAEMEVFGPKGSCGAE